MSPSWTPSRLAWAGLIRAALSQVRRVSGLGSSWSQALLANRPSHTAGSGRKTSSKPALSPARGAGLGMSLPRGATALGFRAVPSTVPVRRAWCQADSKSPGSDWRPQYSRTISRPDRPGSPRRSASTSSADLPP